MRLANISLVAFVLIFCGARATPLEAQIEEGDRVRLTIGSADTQHPIWGNRTVFVGEYRGSLVDAIQVELPSQEVYSVPRESIERMERSLGISRARSMIRYAPYCIIGGMAYGLVFPQDPLGRAASAAIGVAAGVIGATVSGFLFPTEAWEPVVQP